VPPHEPCVSVPTATFYYSKPPQPALLALWHAYQADLAVRCSQLPMLAPTSRDLASMDRWLQEVWERFGLLGPTALGWCSAGLCARDDRRQCIGCPWLVEDYRMLGFAGQWRQMLTIEIARLEHGGLHTDVRQRMRMLDELDGHITMMRYQEILVRARGPLPRFLLLPRPTTESESHAD
jgi:hypothetical protein